jgi:hypothetical protein
MKEQQFCSMKTLITLLSLLMLMVAACKKDDVTPLTNEFKDDPSITSIAGTWKVISYDDLVTNKQILKDSANSWGGLDIVLTFDSNQITGKKTTNTAYGKFAYQAPREITIQEFGGTEINEPQWGRLFAEAVFKFQEFEVNEQYLRLFYNGRKNSVTLQKQ